MEGFIHIFKLKSNYEIQNDITSLLHTYKTKSLKVKEMSSKNIKSIYFTNESEDYPYKNPDEGLFTPVGVFTKEKETIRDYLLNHTNDQNVNYIRNLGGQFGIGYSDFNNQQIILYTHVARIETLYYYISDNVIIVGTDPLIINLIANKGKVEFSIPSMYSFIINGYYGDNLTPFKNVEALPANSQVVINQTGVKINNLDDTLSNLLNKTYDKADYDNLTDMFLEAFNTQDTSKEFKLALTGGKDSRLIFSAMKSNKINLSTYTTGFDDNPDVVIAKRIADLYDVEHRTTSPKISDENTISINLYNKIKKVMLSTSGMVYGYENVGALGKYNGDKSFDGIGAELVKGGFSNFINSDVNSNKLKFVNTFNRNNNMFLDSKNNNFEQFLHEYIDNDLGLHKLQILYSLQFRTGRLTSAAKNASNYIKQSHSPFLDNKFLRESLKVNYLDNKNEEIHYQLMKRLDKRLIDIPYAKDRWRVEKNKPLFAKDYYNWLDRQPFYPNTVLGNYNWRQVQNNDKVIVEQFKNIILSNPKHMIYDIVDFNSVENIFKNKLKSTHMRFIWSLSSVIIFINELSGISNKHLNNDIKITLPSTSINEFKNKKTIIDLTPEFLPLNKSISLDEKNRLITIENLDRHRKLKLFPGKFSVSPEENKINNVKKLVLKIHLTSVDSEQDISGQILYFKSNKLSETQFLEVTKNNKSTEFSHESENLNEYDSFRVLLNFNKLELSEQVKLDYAFYEF